MTPNASWSVHEPKKIEPGRALYGGERSRTVLLHGRERVRDVLEPHLGADSALERANNIAQALAVQDAQPDAVAFEMLRQLPGEARKKLAAAVRVAWLDVEFREFRSRRALETGSHGVRADRPEPTSCR